MRSLVFWGEAASPQRLQTALAADVISTASITLHGLRAVWAEARFFHTPHAFPEKSEIVSGDPVPQFNGLLVERSRAAHVHLHPASEPCAVGQRGGGHAA